MFDFLGYAETHTAITTALICCLIVLLFIAGCLARKSWQFHIHRMKDIQAITAACHAIESSCGRMESSLSEALTDMQTRCDVASCPGLQTVHEGLKDMKTEVETVRTTSERSLTEIRAGVAAAGEEVKKGVYELLETIRAVLSRTEYSKRDRDY